MMDFHVLRTATSPQLALHLRASASEHGADAVTEELLTGIEAETLPPRIFTIWTTASPDPRVIPLALQSDFSRLVRRCAIKRFGRWLRGPRLGEAWTAVGGTAGILDILAEASVKDVRNFCRAIKATASSTCARNERQKYAEDLFTGLHPQLFPDSKFQMTDQRPLRHYYMEILPVCSPEFAESVWERGGSRYREDAVSLCQPFCLALFRAEALRRLNSGKGSLVSAISLAEIDDDFHAGSFQGSRISVNMQFAIEVLGVLSVSAEFPNDFDHSKVCLNVITPLFRRLCRRRCPPIVFASVVEALCEYHRHIPLHQDPINLKGKGIVWYTIQRWSKFPDILSGSLEAVSRLVKTRSNEALACLLRIVIPSLRYRLLRQIMLSAPAYAVDIDNDQELSKIQILWYPSIFQALPRSEGRRLLERIIALRANDSYGHWGPSRSLRTQHRGDPTCLLLALSQEDDDVLEKATTAIEEKKKKAIDARQQPERAFWAGCACDYAIASGSVELYRDTVLWVSTRFAKDALTLKELLSEDALYTSEGIALLCGFPGSKRELRQRRGFPEDVRLRVDIGNVVCEALFTSACQTLEEPTFSPWDAEHALMLLGRVIHSRIDTTRILQDVLDVGDDVIYDVVWKNTLELSLKLESIGLQEEMRGLKFDSVGGALQSAQRRHEVDELCPATLRFIDELARRRDMLWTQYRRRETPDVLSLPVPYPRGLPIQSLLPTQLQKPQKGDHLPFLRKRAETIIFIAGRAALSLPLAESEELVGPFVEDWRAALHLYVFTSDDPKEAALKAWKHATTALSTDRMSLVEAEVFWSDVFTSSTFDSQLGGSIPEGPWSIVQSQNPPYPSVPTAEFSNQPIEWNPDNGISRFEIKSRKLEPTCLDEMLQVCTYPWCDISWPRQGAMEPAIERSAGSFWHRYQSKRSPPDAQEAFVAAALLLNAEVNKISSGVLKNPYPATQAKTARFPALFLAEEFLEKYKNEAKDARLLLERFSDNVPPNLLLGLVKGLILTGKESSVPREAFFLLKLLSRGDNPGLATKLIHWIVLNKPECSSWHRYLFRKGHLHSLPAKAAREFGESMAMSIRTKLNETREMVALGESALDQQPIVKVSTVKMLAQMLSHANFVDEATTIRLLVHVLQDASHLDIRVATIEGLAQILRQSSDQASAKAIMDAFRDQVLPMISNTNERSPMTEEAWVVAESTAMEKLPEVYIPENLGTLPPILDCIVSTVHSNDIDADIKEKLYTKLLLPALEASVESNRRCLQIFFKHFDFPPSAIPHLPVYPQLLLQMLGAHDYLPVQLLDMWFELWKFRNDPPADARAIDKYFKSDNKRLDSNAGRYWMSLSSGDLSRSNTPLSLLTRELTPKVDNGIELVEVQCLVSRLADHVLARLGSPRQIQSDWDELLIRPLTPPLRSQPKIYDRWRKQCRPVVESLIRKVDALRTPAWQKNTERSPKILPDTHQLRLWLIMVPSEPQSLRILADGISSLVDELGVSGRLYSERFNEVKECLQVRIGETEKLKVALILSENVCVDKVSMATVDYLRVDLIRGLIQQARNPPAGDIEASVKRMLEIWSLSPDEDLAFQLRIETQR